MWQETVTLSGPYHFELALDRLKLDPLHVVDLSNKTIKVPLQENTNRTVIEVKGIGNLYKPEFLIKGEGNQQLLMERISEIFGWHTDLKKIHDHFQNTDLKDLFRTHFGTPLVLDFDPFSCLLKCIIHQQLNLNFAFTLTQRFVQTFGHEQDGVWFYPEPEVVANLTVEELRELQFSRRKAEYVIGIGKLIASGKLDFHKMKQQSDEEIASELIEIRGVGPWTVQNFLMSGLGRPNLFPVADIGLQNALKKYYQLEQKPTTAEMEQMKTPWEPYLTYASLYLWRSIE
ncbi:DNA-3-methyladenine glycosylase [Mesobacillus maritimus]|uniref:DNA-3-methyladenine glycosylase family protein n=1 Tax=Mesobacillus maritimus TaxID=1643336 RepID=UPI00203DFA30|nr:DNA-3-methyladenine glycosylase [Mesobacillus maritimus]MCM3585547.1 DNA-3-methyladenine glycosylase [Mesobacillus maritimus]